jgi:hypothetical protein
MIRRTIFLLAAPLLFDTSALAQEGRSIALILDASGSMNAKLAAGGTRLDAAKTAVAAFVEKLDPKVRLSYRAYGHQSPTKEKNCKDTELLVDFNAAGANKDAVLAKTRDIKAQGYTPITYVIEFAAKEVAKEPGERAVVLVSDGKETCEGDPCAAAKALAAADAKLVIHTIGFNVDAAARYQLQCVARVARGTYTDASGAADLGASLGKVAIAKPAPPAAPPPAAKAPPSSKTTITIAKPKPGRLEITNPDVAGHEVTVAESGQAVGQFFGVITSLDLPAGLYNVSFGPTIWKSIEVKPGETTVLDPGVIEMTVVGASGHKVLDWETGVEVGELSGVIYRRSVLPSTFTVTFGGIEWKNIEVKAGEVKVLNPAVISVDPPETGGNKVYAEDGTLVGTILGVISELPVPPGKYTIEVGGEKVPLDLAEGQTMEINLK